MSSGKPTLKSNLGTVMEINVSINTDYTVSPAESIKIEGLPQAHIERINPKAQDLIIYLKNGNKIILKSFYAHPAGLEARLWVEGQLFKLVEDLQNTVEKFLKEFMSDSFSSLVNVAPTPPSKPVPEVKEKDTSTPNLAKALDQIITFEAQDEAIFSKKTFQSPKFTPKDSAQKSTSDFTSLVELKEDQKNLFKNISKLSSLPPDTPAK